MCYTDCIGVKSDLNKTITYYKLALSNGKLGSLEKLIVLNITKLSVEEKFDTALEEVDKVKGIVDDNIILYLKNYIQAKKNKYELITINRLKSNFKTDKINFFTDNDFDLGINDGIYQVKVKGYRFLYSNMDDVYIIADDIEITHMSLEDARKNANNFLNLMNKNGDKNIEKLINDIDIACVDELLNIKKATLAQTTFRLAPSGAIEIIKY